MTSTRPARLALHWQIAISLALAMLAGGLSSPDSTLVHACEFVGTIFLNALKLLVVPLIVASLVHALLGLSDPQALSRMGVRAMVYYIATCLLAVVTGLLMVNLLQPGIIDGQPVGNRLGLGAASPDLLAKVADKNWGDVLEVFHRMVPPNIFDAAAKGDILGLIFFSLLFGYFASRLPENLGKTQREFWGGMREVMLAITGWVMRFAPIGVFALVTKTFASTGLAAVKPLAIFFVAVLLGLAIHMFVNLPITLWLIGRVSPWRHLRAMSPALITAFSSSSSAATLPVTMDCLQNRAGVSSRVTSFVLPLGATINLDGSALYECAVAMFLAQAYGLHLGFATQFLIVWMALVTSMGISGIPSASLVAIAIILGAIGLPLDGIGMILAVDRVLDMCRTAVNVFGDSCGAVIVARLDGEKDVLQKAIS
jgi:proton glutamate symport protein